MRDRIRINGTLYEAASMFGGKQKFYALDKDKQSSSLYVFMDKESRNEFIRDKKWAVPIGESEVAKLGLDTDDPEVETIYTQKRVRVPKWLSDGSWNKVVGIHREFYSYCFDPRLPVKNFTVRDLVLMGSNSAGRDYDNFESALEELESSAKKIERILSNIPSDRRTASRSMVGDTVSFMIEEAVKKLREVVDTEYKA